jgi:hypothetical protein
MNNLVRPTPSIYPLSAILEPKSWVEPRSGGIAPFVAAATASPPITVSRTSVGRTDAKVIANHLRRTARCEFFTL